MSALLKVSATGRGNEFSGGKVRGGASESPPHKAYGRGSIASDGYGKVKAMTESPAVVS